MSLATSQDVSARLRRELTEPEEEAAEILLESATELIVDAVGGDVTTAMLETLDNRTLWVVCVECVVRGFDTPAGARSSSQTLGLYTKSISYTDSQSGGGLFLTEREERMVRRAVFGVSTIGVRLPSLLDEVWCS